MQLIYTIQKWTAQIYREAKITAGYLWLIIIRLAHCGTLWNMAVLVCIIVICYYYKWVLLFLLYSSIIIPLKYF